MKVPLYIITTAYNAADYFERYIYSICSEIKTLNFDVFLYIGIDNCAKTLEKARLWKKTNTEYKNINFFYCENNVGTYILKNSLLKYIRNEECIVLFFDIDDLFVPGFLQPYYNIWCATRVHNPWD